MVVKQPCARLGHLCDYNPRLAFKDDTKRIVAKMRHMKGPDDLIWNGLLFFKIHSHCDAHS